MMALIDWMWGNWKSLKLLRTKWYWRSAYRTRLVRNTSASHCITRIRDAHRSTLHTHTFCVVMRRTQTLACAAVLHSYVIGTETKTAACFLYLFIFLSPPPRLSRCLRVRITTVKNSHSQRTTGSLLNLDPLVDAVAQHVFHRSYLLALKAKMIIFVYCVISRLLVGACAVNGEDEDVQ